MLSLGYIYAISRQWPIMLAFVILTQIDPVYGHYPRYGEVRQIGMLFSLSRSKAAVRGETAALGQ